MITKLKIAAAIFFAFVSLSANSMDGNDLVKFFEKEETDIWPVLYVNGFKDAYILHKHISDKYTDTQAKMNINDRDICFPEKATNKQSADVLKAYLLKNPHKLHESAGILTFQAFYEVWHCTEK